MGIKGYKVFNPDWTCRGVQYEVGKTYVHKGDIKMCGKGFHFCRKASDCFDYYSFDSKNKVAEIEATGLVESEGNKSVTDEIVIVREIEWAEVLTIVNEGRDCTGRSNTGNWNTGNRNTGNWNTGDWNTRNRNTGDRNTGDWNTGNRNTGNWNTGNGNTGNRNTGDWNTGDWNTGDWNTGDWNTGDWNTGNGNTGDWNACNFSSGFLNSKEAPIMLFNKKSSLNRADILGLRGIQVLGWNYENNWWIYSQNMSDEEKKAHPEHETTGGYLKTVDFKTACLIMWEKLSDEEKESIRDIPNFSKKVFFDITGIRA